MLQKTNDTETQALSEEKAVPNEISSEVESGNDQFCKEFRGETVLYLLLAVLAGFVLPIQASFNAGMIDPLNNPIAPAALSFVTGTIVLTMAFPYDQRRQKSSRSKDLQRKETNSSESSVETGDDLEKSNINSDLKEEKNEKSGFSFKSVLESVKKTPKYLFFVPSLIGSVYVTLGAVVGEQIGFSLFFVCIVTGQLLAASCADHFGWFNVQKVKTTLYRGISLVFVLLGAVLSVLERILDSYKDSDEDSDVPGWRVGLFMILSVASGYFLALQAPMNHTLTLHLNTLPHRVVWWAFLVGTVLLIIAWAVSALLPQIDNFDLENFKDVDVWRYFAGPLGALYVFFSVFLTPRIGVSLFFILVIAGQLLSSLIIDSLGLFESAQLDVTFLRLFGVLLVFAASAAFRGEQMVKKAFSEKKVFRSCQKA